MSRCQACTEPFTPARPHYGLCPSCWKRAVADPDQHRPTEWRSLRLAPVDKAVFDEWRGALNLLKAHLGACGSAYPSPTDILMAITRTVLDAPELQPTRWPLEDVLAGTVNCQYPVPTVCGSWATIDSHHLQLRSKGGHDGPRVYLCRSCHDAVHQRRDGIGWRELAALLGYTDIAEDWASPSKWEGGTDESDDT